MKIKKIISAVFATATLMTASVTAYAKDIEIDTDVYQPDEICGYIYLNATTEADIYLKVFKHTPETDENGYNVYDTVIEAETVHVKNTYVYELEYNNFNVENGTYEGYYEIMVGVHKHVGSQDEEDIAYHTINFVVEDTNYTGVESACTIKVNVTPEDLEVPLCVENGQNSNMTYDITFSNISYITGDANNDGKLTVSDAAYIARLLAKGETIDVAINPGADYNQDGKVNVSDAAAIARNLAAAA